MQVAIRIAPEATNLPLTSLHGPKEFPFFAEFLDGNLSEASQRFFNRFLWIVEDGIRSVSGNVIGNRLVTGGPPPLALQRTDVLLQAIVGARNSWLLVAVEQTRRPRLGTSDDVINNHRILREVRLQVCQTVEEMFHLLSHLNTSLSPPTLLRAGHIQNLGQAQYPVLLTAETLILAIPLVPPLRQRLNLLKQRMGMVLQTATHRIVNLLQRFVDFQTGQLERCLPFGLQNRPDGSCIAFQCLLLSLLLLGLGIQLFYLTLDLADATSPFFSSLARELSSSRMGF